MQRQSLGSPGPKLHGHGGGGGGGGGAAKEEKNLIAEDPNRNDDDEEEKTKAIKLHGSLSRPEKLIHLIPLLILFCFFILYLCSHDPSQSDLSHFNGFKRPSNAIDSAEIADFGRFLELDKGDILAIRSLRNLQEIRKHSPRSERSHRKIGDF